MNSAAVKASFNKAHLSYDHACDVQLFAGNKLISLVLPHTKEMARIIDLGCGTGTITQQLAAHTTYQSFHAVDIADQLLAQAKKKLSSPNITVEEANFEALPYPHHSFDLMFANLSLHWSTHFESTIASLADQCDAAGLLAFSIPLTRTFYELQPHFSVNLFADFNQVNDLLINNHFRIIHAENSLKTLHFQSTLEALRSIKNTGASYVQKRLQPTFKCKSLLATPIHQITYHLGFFVAQKYVD